MNRFESTWLGRLRQRGDGVRNARVLVACSGGGDSTALLLFLWAVRRSLGLDLVVACADHGLRPDASQDADFVRRLCRTLDLDLVEAHLEVASRARSEHLGLETAARELRWAWLRAEAASCGAQAVATGHTLDDHTETVLLRLARGGGLGSLTPLPPRQDLRWSPLVEVPRAELRAYLSARGVPWREDATNAEDFTPRNRWRKLLALARAEAPALDRHLWETHRQVRELLEWREAQVARWRGERWEASQGAVRLQGPFPEVELRWILEAAFRLAGWPREAAHLRDLAAWMAPVLARRGRRARTWGRWRLEPVPEPLPWRLTPAP